MRIPALVLLAFASNSYGQTVELKSPDTQITVSISDENNTPSYAIKFKNKAVINKSLLGFEFKTQAAFSDGFKISISNKALTRSGNNLGANAKTLLTNITK